MIAVIVRDDHVVEHGDICLLQNRHDPVRIARDPRRTRLRGRRCALIAREPVSTSIDCPEGETNNVAWPPLCVDEIDVQMFLLLHLLRVNK